MSEKELIAYLVWIGATFALTVAGTLVIVHRAVSLHPKAELTTHFLLRWGVGFGGSLILLAIAAGLVVFRHTTPWDVILTWPWLAGFAVGLGYFLALTGQMDGGSKLCNVGENSSCDTSWGLGAVLLALAAALALGGVFVVAATIRRVLSRLRPSGPASADVGAAR